MFCTSCGNQMPDGAQFCTSCGAAMKTPVAAVVAAPVPAPAPIPAPAPAPVENSVQGMNFDFSTNTATQVSGSRFEYKILSQKDKWFSGKFDPQLLEQAMNAYAQQGWRVISCATADIAGFGTTRQEFITVLEREVK